MSARVSPDVSLGRLTPTDRASSHQLQARLTSFTFLPNVRHADARMHCVATVVDDSLIEVGCRG
jgi:hypothetical protein